MLLGGIEAGGTKFVCAVGDANGNVQERLSIPTTVPEETMAEVIAFFSKCDIKALGVGSFGPVDVDKKSPTFGTITSTPKRAWRNYPLVDELKKTFPIPVGFNTDVNIAALAEATTGAAKGLDSCLYITVGTGIGAGAVVQGNLLQGLSHPEMGHILVRRHEDDNYKGKCPYHGDCLEGLAAGPAIEERWGEKGQYLHEREEVWDLEAYYMAQALMKYILILSPKKIILGGGVMKSESIIQKIQKKTAELLNGYVVLPELTDYIVPPALGDNAGVTGALIIAGQALNQNYLEDK